MFIFERGSGHTPKKPQKTDDDSSLGEMVPANFDEDDSQEGSGYDPWNYNNDESTIDCELKYSRPLCPNRCITHTMQGGCKVPVCC